MAGVKISNLPAIAAPALTDVFPVSQGGVTYKETVTQLQTLLNLNSVTVANIQNQTFTYVADSGAVNAYVATVTSPWTAYQVGQRVDVLISNTNTGPSTLNVSGLGATNIIRPDGSALVAGDLPAGMLAQFEYDGTSFQLLNPIYSLTPPAQSGQKNMIIGGDFSMNPWQRGVSFVATPTAFVADMWRYYQTGAGVVSVLKTADAPTVAQAGVLTQDCLHVDTTTADAAIAAGDIYAIAVGMEGYDWAQLAQRVFTLSFWVKSTKTGIFCVGFRNSGQDRSYVAEYTVNVADTWEYKTITVTASPSAGTWNYTNGLGIGILFSIAVGSTYQTAAGSWAAGNFFATSNQVNGMDNVANNFKLALVKVEAGSSATPWSLEQESIVLQQCQRYYEKSYNQGTYAGALISPSFVDVGSNSLLTGGLNQGTPAFSVTKRTTPAVTIYSYTLGTAGNVSQDNGTDVAVVNTPGQSSFYVTFTNGVGRYQGAFHYVAEAGLVI